MKLYGFKPVFALYTDWDSRANSAPLDQEILHAFPLAQIIRVTRHDLLKPSLYKGLTALFLPGIEGEDSLYPAHVGPAGELIRGYIQDGGIFWAQCAGAFGAGLAARYLREWGPHKYDTGNHLGLYNGEVEGPPEGLRTRDENHFRGLRTTTIIADVLGEMIELDVVYSSGPAFVQSPAQAFRVHARYKNAMGQPPAIISYHYGKGLVLLNGPLLQYAARPAPQLAGYENLGLILNHIAAHETARKRVFGSQMRLILAHARNTGFLSVPAV